VAIYYALVASVIFGAIGLLGGIWADKFDHLAAVTNFIIVPLTFLSGTFYSTSVLPEPIRTFTHFNPVFSLIDGFRFGFIGHADAPLALGATITGVLALVLSYACWAMLKSGYRLRS
jgi:ABC-2 type transport system permease protein